MAKKMGGSTVEFRKFEGERGGFSVRYAGFVFWSLRGYVYSIPVRRVQAMGHM
jgi:hypothetical protein